MKVFFDKTNEIITKNKKEFIIAMAILFFIFSKFFITYELWHNRFNPPSFDDAYFYITNVSQIIEKQSFNPNISGNPNSINYFTYNSILASISAVTGVESDKIFHLFFYLGSLILPFICYIFIKSLADKKNDFIFIAIGLTCLSAFNGYVSYHGFYWVVPSFIMMIFFMAMIGSLEKGELPLVLLITMAFFLSHPMAIYVTFIMASYLILKCFFGSGDFRRALFYICVIMLVIGSIVFCRYAKNIESRGWVSFSFLTEIAKKRVENLIVNEDNQKREVTVTEKNYKNEKTNDSSAEHEDKKSNTYVIKDKQDYFLSEYLLPIISNRPFLFLLLLSLLSLLYLKMLNFLALYLSTLLSGYLATVVNNYGYRFLYFTWIMTFLIVAFFFYAVFKINFKYSKMASSFLLVCFFIFSIYFNSGLVRKINKQDDYFWDKDCICDIIANNNDFIFSTEDKYASSIMLYLKLKNPEMEDNKKTIFAISDENEDIFKSNNVNIRKINKCGFMNFYEK